MISPYANANNGYVGNQTLWEGTNINTAALNSAYGDGSGSGRIYVKNETLRQEYINNYSWSSMLKTGPEGPTLEDMIQVDPTI
jgi:hypothetical protein